MKEIMNGNEAMARGVLRARAEVLPEYLITPSTRVSEILAEDCASGRLNAIYIPMEGEHSSMAAAVGAAYLGARTFVNSCSHGTLYMHEILHTASGMRLPIVFGNVNRAVGLPWNIWTDQNDSLSQRDTGWIQLYCENAQETLDTVIMAYKIAENRGVLLPVMVVTEGFILSHTGEAIDDLEQKLVDKFLPPYKPIHEFDPKNPKIFGAFIRSEEYFKMKIDAQEAMERAKKVIKRIDREFGKIFGRQYGVIEKINWPADNRRNPKIVLVTSGTVTSTARYILSEEKGFEDIGVLKIKMFRPFPTEDVKEALKGTEKVAVIDRNLSLGRGGIFCNEIKSALCDLKKRPEVFSFITGLGGVDITPEIIREAITHTRQHKKTGREILWLPLGIDKTFAKPKYSPPEIIKPSEQNAELLNSGHSACQGCGLILGWRHALRILGPKTFVVIPAGCSTLLAGIYPQKTLELSGCHVNFQTGAPTAAGIKAAIKMRSLEKEIENVLVWAGDGATYDIGFGALSGAAERGNDIIYICANNEAYMNTGVQRSSATPFGAWTTTTPLPNYKPQVKKPITEILACHRIPYAATATIAYLEDFEEKLKKAKELKNGLRFIELLVPCPTGWRFGSELTIKIARLAVLSKVFPLYEVENGEKWKITFEPDEFLEVKEYLKLQGRFSHLGEKEISEIQNYVVKEWQRLKKLTEVFK